MSELLALGVSHKTAPLELRERLALTEGRAVGVLMELIEAPVIGEAAAISTCNRTELFAYTSDPVAAESLALGVLARGAGILPTDLVSHLYSLRGAEAGDHLFRVTAGLDSMIIGEAEVQGQVRRAFELASVEGAAGPVLSRLFRGAIAAGGRVRAETGISRRAMSVPQVAVELAGRTLGDLADRRVLIVGAGETGELTARAFAARGVHAVFVANRHYDRALGLAERYSGTAVHLDDLQAELASADIVVSSTSSPHHVIERDSLEPVLAGRDGRPLLLIDLAVPRDIQPVCRELPGVTVHDMDDLQAIVERNASGREAELPAAERILRSELARFESWLGAQEVAPTIASIRRHGEDVAARVLSENEGRWEGLTEADRERLERMARAIAGRVLHEPTVQLKRASERGNEASVHAARELFGLDAGSEPLEAPDESGAQVTEIGERRRARGER